MIFNSGTFILFFIIFFILYWFITNKNLKLQNLLLLLAGYVFYAWSDLRFLSYLIAVSTFNFYIGIWIEKCSNNRHKQWLLYLGLIQGIGGLAFFKYFNFFIDSFKGGFHLLGINLNIHTLNIIIPLGISFFTFRTISYILDIYKGKIKATKDWVVFFNYISFFPTILSGPIDRAKTLIPQLESKREFTYNQASDGLRQILWGLFKKMVIADNCAFFTNQIFHDYQIYPASSLLLGIFFYTIQLYADFSGYSDMAIGISKLMGFTITKNFDFPFFAQNIAEFWRKWHISLTSWLTDYLFTPLSIVFRDYGKMGLIIAIIINFTIIGIWHGANWTYVLFGFLHGCYFVPLIMNGTMNKKKKIAKDKLLPSLREFINIISTFILVMLTFIIFRSESIFQAVTFVKNLFSISIFSKPVITGITILNHPIIVFGYIIVMLLFEWVHKEKDYGLQFDNKYGFVIRIPIYYFLLFSILIFRAASANQFVYFKF